MNVNGLYEPFSKATFHFYPGPTNLDRVNGHRLRISHDDRVFFIQIDQFQSEIFFPYQGKDFETSLRQDPWPLA